MNRVTGSSASYAIADPHVGNAIADGNNCSGAAIADGLRLREARTHSAKRGGESVALNFGNDIAHKIRAGFRFGEEILARELGRRSLRARGYERRRGPHQHTARE
jgi:hypothetical protein